MVDLTTTIDVGDDKNTATAKRAKIQPTRNGPTNAALTVNVTLHSGVHYKPGSIGPIDLAATYGFTGTADYSIASGSGTWSAASPYTSATLTIPAGAAVGEVSVVTRADNLTEQNLIVCRLATSTAYAPGVSTSADILIFDGPEWTVTELNLNNLGTTTSSLAYAVNNAANPAVAGYGTFYNGSYDSRGGWWQLPANTTYNSLYSPVYRGLSTSPVKLVGTAGNNAVASNPALTGTFNLAHLSGSFPVSQAWGILADETIIVGNSKNGSGTVRPVTWSGSGSSYAAPADLAGTLDAGWAGTAMGINSARQVVGQQYVEYDSGVTANAAFRSQAGATPVSLTFDSDKGEGDILRAPGTMGGDNRTAKANSVNSGGAAVGNFYDAFSNSTNSVFWPATGLASDAAATDLKPWRAKVGTSVDSQSSANSINSSGLIVGWSGNSSGPQRAVHRRVVSSEPREWLDLNDKHFVHGTANWALKEATSINTANTIVGHGTFNGSTRGFILIPRTSGN